MVFHRGAESESESESESPGVVATSQESESPGVVATSQEWESESESIKPPRLGLRMIFYNLTRLGWLKNSF